MQIKKRNGNFENYNSQKIFDALDKAFKSCDVHLEAESIEEMMKDLDLFDGISVEQIQDQLESILKDWDYWEVSEAFKIYRLKHAESRFIRERIDYMERYSDPSTNAATASETDANANISSKNVATLESEVYKVNNRIIQRQRMKSKLYEMFPEVAKQYIKDLENHIIYTHDEASTPVLKPYCMAASLYPLMLDGVGNIDGVTPGPPNDIASFSGQVTNLIFLLSSQCKGAVAISEYFVALNYYVIAEFGDKWYENLDVIINNDYCVKTKTIRSAIFKGFKQFVWGINQPAGNRSYQSPSK